MPAINHPKEGRHAKKNSQEDYSFTGPLHVSASSSFAWARNQKEGHAQVRCHSRSNSRSHLSGAVDLSTNLQTKSTHDSKGQANGNGYEAHADSTGYEPHALAKQEILKKWTELERPDSFDSSDMFHSQDLSEAVYVRDGVSSKYSSLVLVNLLLQFVFNFSVSSLFLISLSVQLVNYLFIWRFLRAIRIKLTELSSRGLCCLNHTRLMNFWRSMNATSAE